MILIHGLLYGNLLFVKFEVMIKLCLFVFLFLSTLSFSQKEMWLEGRGKIGFLAAHRSVMGHLVTDHAFAAEFSCIYRGNGESNWHKAYNKPLFGLTGFYGSVGNRELMGNFAGAYGFISIPLISANNYSFSGRIGLGLGYAGRIWDINDNVLSIGVSTHLNALVSLAIENRFEFGPHSFNSILDMTHFSNGGIKVPNLGLNLPYLSFGYGYRIRKANLEQIPVHDAFNKKWEFGAVGFISAQEIFPVGGEKYPVGGVNAVLRRYFNRSVGAEVSLDWIQKQSILMYHEDVPKTQLEIMQIGVFAGYLLPLDKLHLLFGMGYYIKDKFSPQDDVYHRVGIRYIFNSGINLNLVLKSHWARADYVEYGIGYTLNR